MNTLGYSFRVSSFGESHGTAVGCVIDGCPAGLPLNLEAIQQAVDRRKTQQNSFSTARKEEDRVQILSGVFDAKTTGSPIALLIYNQDAQSSDYEALKDIYRPNHADFTYQQKYGHRDYRGGGRSSIRITAPLVAAGDIARQLIQQTYNTQVLAYVSQIGDISLTECVDVESLTHQQIDRYEVRCPHEETALRMRQHIEQVQAEGDTLGGIISTNIKQAPAGWGQPIFGKLQAELAKAMLCINTVKGFEYGDGFLSASRKGSEHNDNFAFQDQTVSTKTNHSGGIQGGISNGMDICFRVALKPISSIRKPQESLNTQNQTVPLTIGGRHDACAVPRAIPIVEAYTWLVLADAFLQHKNASISYETTSF